MPAARPVGVQRLISILLRTPSRKHNRPGLWGIEIDQHPTCGAVALHGGTGAGASTGGALSFVSGGSGSGKSGSVVIGSAATTTGATGDVLMESGGSPTGETGSVCVGAGASSGQASGSTTITAGSANGGSGGQVRVSAGNSMSQAGSAGDVLLTSDYRADVRAVVSWYERYVVSRSVRRAKTGCVA